MSCPYGECRKGATCSRCLKDKELKLDLSSALKEKK